MRHDWGNACPSHLIPMKQYLSFLPTPFLLPIIEKCFVVVVVVVVRERQGLALSPRLECNGVSIAHCSFELLDSKDPHALASHSAGTTVMSHHTSQSVTLLQMVLNLGEFDASSESPCSKLAPWDCFLCWGAAMMSIRAIHSIHICRAIAYPTAGAELWDLTD